MNPTITQWLSIYKELRKRFPGSDPLELVDATCEIEAELWLKAKEIDETQSEKTDWRV